MKLLKIISKNFKILLRSKTSAFVVLIGPLLIIALIALALSNAQDYKLTVGIVTVENEGLTGQFISQLERNDYEIINYTSIEQCVEQIKLKNTNICIKFPANFVLSNENTPQVEFYADQSRVNLVESIVSSVSSTISLKSDEITLGLTNNLLDTINLTSNEINKEKVSIERIKSETSSANSNIDKVTKNSLAVTSHLTSTEAKLDDVDAGEISTSVTSLKTKTDNLLYDLDNLIDEIEDMDLEEAGLSRPSSLNKVKEHYSTLKTISSSETTSINNAVESLEDVIDSVTNEVKSANDYEIKSYADKVKIDIKSVEDKIAEIESNIKAIKDKVDLVEITSASNIVNPFTIKVNPITSTSDRSTFMFPYFITLIILFVGLMLSSSLIVLEKKSQAFFRNFTTPTSEAYHFIAGFFTNFIVITLQLAIVFTGAYYYLKIPILNNYPVTLTILLLSLSFFILLGTLIGYILKTQEGTTIASISVGSISLFLSNLILPIESFPSFIRTIFSFNPFVLCSEMFKKSMLFSSNFKSIEFELLVLGGYIAVVCSLVIIFHEISLNKFFSVITNLRILHRTHFTKENGLLLRDGTVIKNKVDLLNALKEMEDDEFKQFVTKRHNEFSLWIKASFKERKLAHSIKKAKTKAKIIEVLKENLEQSGEEDVNRGFGLGRIRFKIVK